MRDPADNATFDIYEALQNGIGLDPAAIKVARDEIEAEKEPASKSATSDENAAKAPARRGRPPKHPTGPMTAAERQRAYRRRIQNNAIGRAGTNVGDLTLKELMERLHQYTTHLQHHGSPGAQMIISEVLDELRLRLVDLPI